MMDYDILPEPDTSKDREQIALVRTLQAEIERLKSEVIRLEAIANTDTPELEMQQAEIERLKQENDKLREALAEIVKYNCGSSFCGSYARAALNQTEGK